MRVPGFSMVCGLQPQRVYRDSSYPPYEQGRPFTALTTSRLQQALHYKQAPEVTSATVHSWSSRSQKRVEKVEHPCSIRAREHFYLEACTYLRQRGAHTYMERAQMFTPFTPSPLPASHRPPRWCLPSARLRRVQLGPDNGRTDATFLHYLLSLTLQALEHHTPYLSDTYRFHPRPSHPGLDHRVYFVALEDALFSLS